MRSVDDQRTDGGERRRAVAHIDLRAVRHNLRALSDRLDSATMCAVVKADAYGHGAVPVARLAVEEGASRLAVATSGEAAELRRAGLTDVPVLVLGPLGAEELAEAIGARAEVVAWSADFVRRLPRDVAVHVKIDTGMARHGVEDLPAAIQLLDALGSRGTGLMTHFATADDPSSMLFDRQLGQFRAAVASVRASGRRVVAHAANTAAVLRTPDAHFDMVRCGIGLYGIDPANVGARAHGLHPALRLTSYVSSIRSKAPRDTVGYGATYRVAGRTRVATVPIGYGDGVSRAHSDRGAVLVNEQEFPIVGRVSMDALMIDIGDSPDVVVGDEVTLVGDRLTAEVVSARIGTIGYELTTGLSARVQRRHLP